MVSSSPDPAIGREVAAAAPTMAVMRADFLVFYDAERPRLLRYLLHSGATWEEAQDAAAEAFLRAWVYVMDGRWSQIREPRWWIRKVASNAWHRECRSQATHEPPDVATAHLSGIELTEQGMDVLRALRRITNLIAREVMALHIDGFTGPQIASILEIEEQRVRDLRKQARRELKQLLGAYHQHTTTATSPTASAEGRDGR